MGRSADADVCGFLAPKNLLNSENEAQTVPVITKTALAAELKLTKGRVSQYVSAGMPVRADGKLDSDAAMAWVKLNRSTVRSADKGATRAAKLAPKPEQPAEAELDLEGERRRKLRLDNDEKEHRLIPDTVFEQACDMLVGPALVDLLSLPGRVTDDLALRRRLEDEIDGIRARHARRLQRVMQGAKGERDLSDMEDGDGEVEA